MPYLITPSGDVTVEFDFEELTLNQFTTEFKSFSTNLQTIRMPIKRFTLDWSNICHLDEGSNYADAVGSALDELSSTLDSIQHWFTPDTLQVSFTSYETLVENDDLNISILNFIENFPNTNAVKNLELDLHNIDCDIPERGFNDDFLDQFISLERFAFEANYINSLSVNNLMVFITDHALLKSIDINLAGAPNTFDLRNIMLNENLTTVKFRHSALYPTAWSEDGDENAISDEWKLNYWAELGDRIKQHPNLNSFHFNIANDFDKNDHPNITNALINDFLHAIAFNRSLNTLKVIIDNEHQPFREEATAITQQHFLDNSSIENLTIKLKGIILLTVVQLEERLIEQPYAPLREQTLANRALLQSLAATPNPDLTIPPLHLAKYVPHFVAQAYQPINEENMESVRFKLGYISHMLKNIKLYDLPIDLIADHVLSFLQPKDACRLSAATGGFFYQKRLEIEAPQPSDLLLQRHPLN